MKHYFIFQRLIFTSLFFYTIAISQSVRAQVCSGAPVLGNTVASTTAACPGVPVTLSIQNIATLGTGIAFQWFKSSMPIIGASNATYTFVPIGPSTFWCNVTCTVSGLAASSTPVTIILASWNNCYCPSNATTPQEQEIYNVTLNGSATNPLYSYSSGCVNAAPGPGSMLSQYSNFMSLPPIATLYKGLSSPLTIELDECDGAPYYNDSVGIWIDLNHNGGFFDPGEQVFMSNLNTGPSTISGSFVIPASSLVGNTIMRVVCTEGATPTPCGTYAYGETEDYLITILPPPCITPPFPGNTLASPTIVCGSGTSNLSLQNSIPSNPFISFQWYNSAGSISGATNSTYNTTITATDTYYCIVTCIPSAFTLTSFPTTVQLSMPNTGSSSVTACDSYVWNSTLLLSSGIYLGTFTNAGGCDSVHTLNLTINQSSPSTTVALSGCDSVQLNGISYFTSGTFVQVYTNVVGCDSLVFINTTVFYSSLGTAFIISGCDSAQYNGTTYTNSGVYTQTYVNAVGCDSVVTVNLIIHQSSSSTITLNGCDSILYNGITYSSSGAFTQTLGNTVGCDSVIYINTIVNYSNDSIVYITGCDSLVYNGITYTSSGFYSQTYVNAAGCDSVETVDVNINQTTDSNINAMACNMFILNGQTYTNTGNYTQTILNSAGCDSTITLQVVIDTLNAFININGISISTPSIGSYQWLNCTTNTPIPGATNATFTPIVSGSYAIIVTAAGCIDTSACVSFWMTNTNNFTTDNNNLIYPNPNSGIFEIELNDAAEISVVNSISEMVLQKEYSKGKHLIDISKYASGIYFLKINTEDKSEIFKLIKE